MLERSWVQIPAPYTVWTFGHFFTLICSKNCIVCMKRPIINKKVAGVGPFKKQTNGKNYKLGRFETFNHTFSV